VTIEDSGLYTAQSVERATAPARDSGGTERRRRATVIVQPHTAADPDEPARPRLKRGIPERGKQAHEQEGADCASDTPPAAFEQ
jgi:hypothetical protein